MPSSWNAAILYANLVDTGIVTASSSLLLTPPSVLQDPHVARKWRGLAGDEEYLLVDLGADQLVNTYASFGVPLSDAATMRVRVSSLDPSAALGDVYDSGLMQAGDPRYSSAIHLGPDVYGRFVRMDLKNPGAEFVEAGRYVVGYRNQFDFNFDFNWTRGYVDLSRRTVVSGGQTHVDPRVSYRAVQLTFPAISEAQRQGFVEEIDRVNGTHEDVLLITRSDSDNLGRDCIWGLLDDGGLVTQPSGWHDGAPIYSRPYSIKERL